MSGHRALIVTIAALICLLLLGGAALAGAPSASGLGYRLAPSPWHVQGTVGGPGYLLQGQGHPLQTGPCCCSHLPCIMRDAP